MISEIIVKYFIIIFGYVSLFFTEILQKIFIGFLRACYGFKVIFTNEDWEDAKRVTRDSSLSKSKTQKSRPRDLSIKKEENFCVRSQVFRCCGHNFVSFGASLLIFNYFFLNILEFFLYYTLSEETASNLWKFSNAFLSTVFNVFWAIPLFFLFKILNTFWFQDIANMAYKIRYGKSQVFPIAGIGNQISDVIFSVIIETLFLVQASVMPYIPNPYLAWFMTYIHFSLLNALYAYEYLWCHKGWTCYQRIRYVEANWPYFLGFGLPLSLITFYFSSVMYSGIAYSMFFPFFIIGAIHSEPIEQKKGFPPLKIFSGVIWFASIATKKLNLMIKIFSFLQPTQKFHEIIRDYIFRYLTTGTAADG